jgi:hypothetical protein
LAQAAVVPWVTMAGGAVMINTDTFVRILGFGGTFVFAISGVVANINRRLDISASSSCRS